MSAPADLDELEALFSVAEVPDAVDRWRVMVETGATTRPRPHSRSRRRVLGLAPIPALAALVAGLTVAAAALAVVVAGHPATPPPPAPVVRPSPVVSAPATPKPTSAPTVAGHPSPSPKATATPAPTRRPAPVQPAPSVAPSAPATTTTAWPGASSTGVPVGTHLTAYSGDYTVTTNGATVSGLDIAGSIIVKANNVTVTHVRVTVGGYWGIHQFPGFSGLTVTDTEVSGGVQFGIFDEGSGMTVLRCNIHGVNDGVSPGDNAVIQDSYIHDLLGSTSDNGIYVGGGNTGLIIRHNTILLHTGNGAVDLFTAFGPDVNVLVDDNLVAGGGYTLRGGQATGSSSIRFTNNHVSRMFYPNGGIYGPSTSYDPSEPGNQWSGNVWDDSGAAILP